MKEEIEKFKQDNGNADFTQKEMIMYLVSRVDTIFDKLDHCAGGLAENRARLNGISKMIYIGVPILLSVIGYMFIKLAGWI